jgi:hypothetical protein
MSGSSFRAGGVLSALLAFLHFSHFPAAAQRWQLDASGTRVRFDTVATLTSGSVGPFLEWQRGGAFTTLSGSVSGFERGDWAAQGRGDLSLLVDPLGPLSPLRLELVGAVAGTYHTRGFRTAATRGELRFHVSGRYVGVWAGSVAGTGWVSSGDALATAAGATTGVWGRYGPTRVGLSFVPLRIEGSWFPEVDLRGSSLAGPVEVAAYGGWRGSPAASGIDASARGGGSATWWVTQNVALVLAGGSYSSDLLQGLPGGRFLAGGLRLATRRPLVLSVRPVAPPAYRREDGSGRLRFVVPGARRVEVVGDWTQWQPVPMERARDGAWVLNVALPSGVYRFNVILDGEQWAVPSGVASVDDGFGGQTGVFIVP